MSSAVAELDGYLQSMLALKPPGVSGSKINSITQLCSANVQVSSPTFMGILRLEKPHINFPLLPWQSESVLIQKIYTHFKRAPPSHKLGVLYVVDSVTRQWVDAARKAGQPIGSTASDGTFAAGVNKVTELLPVLMNDIISTAPEDQKVRNRSKITMSFNHSTHARLGRFRLTHWADGIWLLLLDQLHPVAAANHHPKRIFCLSPVKWACLFYSHPSALCSNSQTYVFSCLLV